jgi:hypothetical protein
LSGRNMACTSSLDRGLILTSPPAKVNDPIRVGIYFLPGSMSSQMRRPADNMGISMG